MRGVSFAWLHDLPNTTCNFYTNLYLKTGKEKRKIRTTFVNELRKAFLASYCRTLGRITRVGSFNGDLD